jgi:hypothetical protein
MIDQPASMERLTTLESRVAHLRELMDERDRTTSMRITDLIAHNRVQDMEAEKLADRLGKKIEDIQATLWSGLKWLGGTLILTLLSVVLKTLGLL